MARKISEKGMIKKLDDYYREVIRQRDKKCVWCGKPSGRLEVSHVIPKGRCLRLRWDPMNMKLLCFDCHYTRWHLRAEGRAWFDKAYPERAKYLSEHEHDLVKRSQFIKEKYQELEVK